MAHIDTSNATGANNGAACSSNCTRLTELIPSLPCAVQSVSAFMQLPAEVRLMILRELLTSAQSLSFRQSYQQPVPLPVYQQPMVNKSSRSSLPRKAKAKTLETKEKTQKKVKMVHGYGLSPTILSTCQDLLYEGLPILYQENILGISLTADYRSYLNLPYKQREASDEGLASAFVLPSSEVLICIDAHGCYSENASLHVATKDFALKFKKLELILDVEADERKANYYRLRRLLKALAPLLRETCIQAKSATPTMLAVGANFKRFFNLFQLVRCKKFKLPEATSEFEATLRKVVTSDNPVRDLSVDKAKMNYFISWCWSLGSEVTDYQWGKQKLRELHEAIEAFDRDKFSLIRSQFVARHDASIAKLKAEMFGEEN